MMLLNKCNIKNNDGMDNFGFGIVSMFRLTRYLAFFYAVASLLSLVMIIINYTADGISLHVPSVILAMVHMTLGNIGFSETRCNFNQVNLNQAVTYQCEKGVLSEIQTYGLMPHNRTILQQEGHKLNFCGKAEDSPAVSACTKYMRHQEMASDW